MCGRYYIDQEEDLAEMRQILEEVNRRFHDSPALVAMHTDEIAPSHVVPVLRPEQAGAQSRIIPDLMQWGFPQYQGSGLLINARAETAAAKPMFTTATRIGRILVPASAFFEWKHLPQGRKGTKIKLLLPDEPTFYMAGLARRFPDSPGSVANLQRFVILTTAANESVASIHDRMPLILPHRLLRRWLLDDQATESFLQMSVDKLLAQIEVA